MTHIPAVQHMWERQHGIEVTKVADSVDSPHHDEPHTQQRIERPVKTEVGSMMVVHSAVAAPLVTVQQ
jgi:hypothetical protein